MKQLKDILKKQVLIILMGENKMSFIKMMKEKALIYEKDGKYFSCCVLDEEITIEIKELEQELERCKIK
jgi:hypothetical protein